MEERTAKEGLAVDDEEGLEGENEEGVEEEDVGGHSATLRGLETEEGLQGVEAQMGDPGGGKRTEELEAIEGRPSEIGQWVEASARLKGRQSLA